MFFIDLLVILCKQLVSCMGQLQLSYLSGIGLFGSGLLWDMSRLSPLFLLALIQDHHRMYQHIAALSVTAQ